jgi:hypothetical protein
VQVNLVIDNDDGGRRSLPPVRTNDQGGFRFDGIVAIGGRMFQLSAQSGSQLGRLRGTFFASGDQQELVLSLKPRERVDVRIGDPESRPIANARLACVVEWMDGGSSCGHWTSDDHGLATLGADARGHWIGIREPGFVEAWRWIDFYAEAPDVVEVRLERAVEASGTVLDENRRPRSDIRLSLCWQEPMARARARAWIGSLSDDDSRERTNHRRSCESVVSDADGRFHFENAAPGKNSLTVLRHPQAHHVVELPKSGIEIIVRSLGSVEGVVLQPDGRGAAGVEVRLVPSARPGGPTPDTFFLRTTQGGSFVLHELPVGEYVVEVGSEFKTAVRVDRDTRAKLRIQLPGKSSLPEPQHQNKAASPPR